MKMYKKRSIKFIIVMGIILTLLLAMPLTGYACDYRMRICGCCGTDSSSKDDCNSPDCPDSSAFPQHPPACPGGCGGNVETCNCPEPGGNGGGNSGNSSGGGNGGSTANAPAAVANVPVSVSTSAWGGSGNVSFTIQKSAQDFKSAKANWGWIDPSNFTVTSGSTIITFSPDFLRTLPVGLNVFHFEFTTGTVEVFLTTGAGGIPRTNDNSNISVWMTVLVISITGALGSVTTYKLKYGKQK